MRKNKKEKTKSNTKLTNNPISLPDNNSERDDNFYLLEENNPNPNSNNFKLKYKHTGEFNNIVDNNSKLINNETKNNKNLNNKSKNKLEQIIPKDKKKPEKNSTTRLYPKPKSVKNKNKNRKKKTKSINKTTKAKENIEVNSEDDESLEENKKNKFYLQKPENENEELKIILEINTITYDPIILPSIDLNIFKDNKSIIKSIIYYSYDKPNNNFVVLIYFIYSNIKNNENISDEIISKKIFEHQKTIEKDSEDDTKNNIEEQESVSDNDISLKIILKRFKDVHKDNLIARCIKNLKKTENIYDFQYLKINNKEDMTLYENNNQIFYILTFKKENITNNNSILKTLPIKKIGIYNEGNTCYMNSIIQTLFNNPFFITSIMQIETELIYLKNNKEESLNKNVINALKNIFLRLWQNKTAIHITEIFHAFDWERCFWNSPQDAEEIYMSIYDIISKYSKNIIENCEGILINSIIVQEINYNSSKEENFFFLQLDIENSDSVNECLENFFKCEDLTGDNKYQHIDQISKKETLYNAKKYYKFKKIPNILFIQLKRFKYDMNDQSFHKINKKISYEETINLNNYLLKKNNQENQEYILYSIIAHSGNVISTGHYFCFIKNFEYKCYIEFNDKNVDLASKNEVLDELYGGFNEIFTIQKIKNKKKFEVVEEKEEKIENAYILIYIKKEKMSEIFNYEKIDAVFEDYKIKQQKKEDEQRTKKEKTIKDNEKNKVNKKEKIQSRNSYINKYRKNVMIQNNDDFQFDVMFNELNDANKILVTTNGKKTSKKRSKNQAMYDYVDNKKKQIVVSLKNYIDKNTNIKPNIFDNKIKDNEINNIYS